jgi:hypothetical protein
MVRTVQRTVRFDAGAVWGGSAAASGLSLLDVR